MLPVDEVQYPQQQQQQQQQAASKNGGNGHGGNGSDHHERHQLTAKVGDGYTTVVVLMGEDLKS